MQRFARIAGGVVAEIITLPDGIDIAAAFHPSIAGACRPAGGEVDTGWVLDGDDLVAPPPPPAPAKADLTKYAAAARWRREVGGIEFNGIQIRTDENSQTKILGAYVAASRNPGWTTLWESVHPIDATTMLDLGDAVQEHINETFATRASVYEAIETGEITTFAEIDAAFA